MTVSRITSARPDGASRRRPAPPPRPVPDPAGRVPPHDLDAEAAVLAACMLEGSVLARVRPMLAPEHFYSDANGRIYEAAQELAAAGTPVDIVTVKAQLEASGHASPPGTGWPSYLAQLADATPAVAHVEAHARRVVDLALDRRTIAAHQRAAAEGYGTDGREAWRDTHRAELDAIADERRALQAPPSPELAAVALALEAGDGATARRLLEADLAAGAAARESPEGRAERAAVERAKALDVLGAAGTTPDEREAAQGKALAFLDKAAAIEDPPAGLILGGRPLSADDLASPLPPVQWLSPGLQLGPGRPNLLLGFSGSAKSLASLAIAVSLAAGLPIFGWFRVPQRKRVLILSKDSGQRTMRGRLERIARGLGVDLAELIRAGWLLAVPDPTVNLIDEAGIEAIRASAQGFDLCIMDAFRGFIPGVDENDSRIRDYLDPLKVVSDSTGCAFLVLHHEGKSGVNAAGKSARGARPDDEAGRGSAGIQDAAGAVFRMVREEHNGERVYGFRMAKAPEEPPAPWLEPFYVAIEDLVSEDRSDRRWGMGLSYRTVEQIQGPSGDKAGSGSADFEADRDRAREALRGHPGIPGNEAWIGKMAGMGTARRKSAARALTDAGEVENRGTKNRPRLYLVDPHPGPSGPTSGPPATPLAVPAPLSSEAGRGAPTEPVLLGHNPSRSTGPASQPEPVLLGPAPLEGAELRAGYDPSWPSSPPENRPGPTSTAEPTAAVVGAPELPEPPTLDEEGPEDRQRIAAALAAERARTAALAAGPPSTLAPPWRSPPAGMPQPWHSAGRATLAPPPEPSQPPTREGPT